MLLNITCRRYQPEDRMSVYTLFRNSLWDYMLKYGIVDETETEDIAECFQRQGGLLKHLEKSAFEDWIAEDETGKPVGWARSVERNGHLQLTHFFVDSSSQGLGIGNRLLDLAFPVNHSGQRSIIATINTSALALYLRYGVYVQGMAFSLFGQVSKRTCPTDLQVHKMNPGESLLQTLTELDSTIVGYSRKIDLAYFMDNQPVFLFKRKGDIVAYAFGCKGALLGPAGALDPADLPAVLTQIEQDALDQGLTELSWTIPAQAKFALNWALSCGYKIDPFYEVLLASDSRINLDRYLITNCAFIW